MVEIRAMTPMDWTAVAQIYAEGIATGDATFETDVPTWEEFDASRFPEHHLVASIDHRASAGQRSVYVTADVRGRGVGRALMDALLRSADAGGIWTLQTSIFPENVASVALHERVGFRIVGRREHIAQLDGVWRDALLLERRSQAVS